MCGSNSFPDNEESATAIYVCPSIPLGNCQWEGQASRIVQHFQDEHQHLLIKSDSIKVDLTQEIQQNSLITSCEHGIFLVQVRVCLASTKLSIYLRMLGSVEEASRLRYGVEIVSNQFCFTNETFCGGGYSPVYNVENGVEVDFKAIYLMNSSSVQYLTVKFNIIHRADEGFKGCGSCLEGGAGRRNSDQIRSDNCDNRDAAAVITTNNEEATTSPDEEGEGKSFLIADRGDFIQNYLVTTEGDDNEAISKRQQQNGDHEQLIDETSLEEETTPPNNKKRLGVLDQQLLKCKNCSNSMTPPIYMCPEGHSVCYGCKKGICIICLKHITTDRNIDLEERSKTLEYRCRYEINGCKEKFKYDQIRRHEIYCDFCIYKCELCDVEGRLHEIKGHYRIWHPSTKQYETGVNVPFTRGSSFVIINAMGVFYCTCAGSESYNEWQVYYSGPKERSFSCEVRILGKKNYQHNSRTYFLKRAGNVFRFTVSCDELKKANVKEKHAKLHITAY